MNLRRFLLPLIGTFFIFSACSVYKSSGRKSFENKAPENVRASSLSAQSDICWNQPAKDPLWHIDPNFPLSVSPLDNEEIQVCIQDL